MMNSNKGVRHCAFCLDSITDQAVKLCGKCNKRAYCSRDCQVADWKTNGKGQGHKNWCHLECGEEDLDWEVAAVPGKGLGLIAKRVLPAKFRIIVDACRPRNHPAIKDLMPLDGTDEEKFRLNRLGCDDGNSVLCLRISRANHLCDPNADHVYDDTFKVKILFAEKEIQEGEEISINYQLYNDISKNISAELARTVLKNHYGIICSDDCYCYNKEVEKVIRKSKDLDSKIIQLASQRTPKSTDAALNAVNELLKNSEIIHSLWLNKKRTLYDGFQIAITRKKTLKQAEDFIREAHDIVSSILHPDSEDVLKFQRFMNDPQTHHSYLLLN